MKKTITKMLGLALGALSLTATAQCPTVSSVNLTASTFSPGLVQVTANLSGTVDPNNTTYIAYANNNYQSFGNSNSGYFYFANNGTYSVCVSFSDSTSMCYGSNCAVITITNAANSGTTTNTCPTLSSMSYSMGSNPGQYILLANVAGSYTGTTNFSAYASGPGYVISESGFGMYNSGTLTFDQNGTYNVCMYLTDSVQGCYDYICTNINVTNAGSVSTPTCFADASFALYQDSTNLGTYYAYNYGGGTGNGSYLWNFGDGTTSTQAYPTHVYASAGFYTLCLTVTATDSAGNSTCTDTQCSVGGFKIATSGQMGKIVVMNPNGTTGVKEYANVTASFNAYPNPLSDELNIEVALTNNSTALVYTIVDALGKVVAQNKLTDSKTTINTASLEKGFYFLSVSTEKVKF